MDIYYEYMLKKKIGAKEMILSFLLAGVAIFLCAVVILLAFAIPNVMAFGLLAIFGIWWGYVWLIKGFLAEYEYTLTNHELDIDVIKGKSRRKRITTINLKKIEFFGNRNNPEIQKRLAAAKPRKEYYFVSGKKDEEIYVTDVTSRFDGSLVRVNIAPDREMLKNMRLANPGAIMIEENAE